ncbi:hypothetical protein [Nocardia sp. NPDC006630]
MFKGILTVCGKSTWSRQKSQDYIADSHGARVMALPVSAKIYT